MKKFVVSAAVAGLSLGGIALSTGASASTHHHHARHHDGAVKQAPCKGLGIDIALGSKNFCIPL